MGWQYLFLFVLSMLSFLFGYASLRNKLKRLLDWNIPKGISDFKGYRKHQGIYYIVLGAIFLCMAISGYFVEKYSVDPRVLFYVWVFIIFLSGIIEKVLAKKYY